MKVAQLRAATMLIEKLDELELALEAVRKAKTLNPVGVVITNVVGKQLKFKPSYDNYLEFLALRRDAVTGLLKKMGVDVSV